MRARSQERSDQLLHGPEEVAQALVTVCSR